MMYLNKSNFRLESKPAVTEVATVTRRLQPPRAMLLIDISDSMRTPGKLKVISSLARGFVDASAANSSLALLTFSDQVKDRLGFPASKEVLLEKLEAISREPLNAKGGWTALFDAMTEAAQMFDSPQPGDVVFLISDGADNRSHTQMREVKRLLLERRLRLFCFVPFEQDLTEEGRVGPVSLTNVAQDTGARSFTLKGDPRMWGWDASEQSLSRDYEFGKYMYVLAASRYELEIDVQGAIQKPVSLKLKIVGADGEVMHSVQSLYPQELTACTQPKQN